MASGGGSSKKSKKKRNSAPVISSPNTITYGPPPTTVASQGMPVHQPGYAVQPNFYAPEGYPLQPPGGYPAPVLAGGVPRMAVPAPAPALATPTMQPPQRLPQRPPSRQLDFDQAMADFKGMFPKMDREVIETVLRSNDGKVDETIDQLLKLNADIPEAARPPVMPPSTGVPVPPSQLPPGMFSSGSFPDEPPPYSPPEPDSPFSRFNSNSSIQSSTITTPAPSISHGRGATTVSQTPPQPPAPRRTRSVGGDESVSNAARENYRNVMQRMGELQTSREWNPPVIGHLPSDFLRLSVSGDPPSSTSSPSTPQTSQTRMTPGIQQRLNENTNRRRSVDQNDLESNQMLDDEKLALMLQNEEFLRQLQQDPEFLSSLERDYHDALREGRTASNTPSATSATATTTTTPTPSPISPPPRSSQAPLYRQPPPGMVNRPLPATPGPELPARPPGLRKETSGSSLPSPSSAGGNRASMTNGMTSASGGLSVEDIEFRNKLEHMGKSSKTKFTLLAGRFQKKKKGTKKYEAEDGGATDSLLGGESLYEELREDNISHEVKRKSSKKRHSFGRQHSLLSYEDCDPNFFSR